MDTVMTIGGITAIIAVSLLFFGMLASGHSAAPRLEQDGDPEADG